MVGQAITDAVSPGTRTSHEVRSKSNKRRKRLGCLTFLDRTGVWPRSKISGLRKRLVEEQGYQ